jgi:hypothetical protein
MIIKIIWIIRVVGIIWIIRVVGIIWIIRVVGIIWVSWVTQFSRGIWFHLVKRAFKRLLNKQL